MRSGSNIVSPRALFIQYNYSTMSKVNTSLKSLSLGYNDAYTFLDFIIVFRDNERCSPVRALLDSSTEMQHLCNYRRCLCTTPHSETRGTTTFIRRYILDSLSNLTVHKNSMNGLHQDAHCVTLY